MGLTYVDATVTGPTGKSQKLELLVDSGASYSLLPEDVWRDLGLEPDPAGTSPTTCSRAGVSFRASRTSDRRTA